MVENTLSKIIKKKEQKLNELKKITSIELLKEKKYKKIHNLQLNKLNLIINR